MKKLLFIILFFFLFINVYAKEKNEQFYSGEWIPNIYIVKEKNGVIHYKQARFINKKSDNGVAYCIEPFETMKENSNYKGYDSDYTNYLKIGKSVWDKINLIGYYGYGYGNHLSDKWYVITQIMIWREVDKNASFYFTDGLNGPKINKYDAEIKEINSLVSKHFIIPTFANKTFTYSINSSNELIDVNKVINDYSITQNGNVNVIKKDNKLIIETSAEEKAVIKFEKNFQNYNSRTYVFVDGTYQNLISPGNVDSIIFNLTINVSGGKIKITKLDFDTNEKNPSGEGILIGSKYDVFNSNGDIVQTLIIDENYEAVTELLPFGEYIIKEKESMSGYLLDENEYKVNLGENSPYIELALKNKAIKSVLQIKKYFDEKLEPGIIFEIFNNNKELINTIVTDKNGEAKIELFYGHYTIHQVNSTKNYKPVEDFTIEIDSNSPQIISLDLFDEKFSSMLVIVKKDLETGKIINDETVFKIYDIDNGKYLTVNDEDEFKTISGKIVIDSVPAGNYFLEEYKAPKGYVKNESKISFSIDEDNSFKYEDNIPILEIEVYDEKEQIEVDVPNTHQDIKQDVFIYFDNKKKKLARLFC